MGSRAGAPVAQDFGRSLVLTPWWEVGPGSSLALSDPGAAAAMARRLIGGVDGWGVRRALARIEPFSAVPRADEDLASVLAARLVDGRLRVSLVERAALWAEDGEAVEALQSLEREAAEAPEIEEEECIPCREKNAQHQAAVLVQASQDGAPFCAMG